MLATKLFTPIPRRQLVARPRLLEQLDGTLDAGHRLTVISAPAGFGKTTLLSDWPSQRDPSSSPTRVSWLSLDDGDNDIPRFLTHVVADLMAAPARLTSAASSPARRLPRSGRPDGRPSPPHVGHCPPGQSHRHSQHVVTPGHNLAPYVSDIPWHPPRIYRNKEMDMTITPTTLIRGAGVAAVVAGLIFIGVQINHPHLDATSVTTTEVVFRNSLKVLMCALALVGITGMYLRQVKQTGVLGLIGYLVFGAGGHWRHHDRRYRLAADRFPAPGLRLPGRRPRLRPRAVPGTLLTRWAAALLAVSGIISAALLVMPERSTGSWPSRTASR